MKDFLSAQTLAKAVVDGLEARGLSVALAESCTGGLLAKTRTDVPGASNVFECGVVAYSEDIKQRVLGVRAETLRDHSVVSPEVALEMARGVRALAESDFGIGITGVAGPGPDGDHPEGEIYIALSDDTKETVLVLTDRTEQARTLHRARAAYAALRMLTQRLSELPPRQDG